MKCYSFCLAHTIDLARFEDFLKRQNVSTHRYEDCLLLNTKAKQQLCFYFNNGTIVTWNVLKPEIKAYQQSVKPFCTQLLPDAISDGFIYTLSDEVHFFPHEYFNADMFTLEADEIDLKLALSYGFSNSIKLKMYEVLIESLVTQYNPMIRELAINPQKRISSRAIYKIICTILETKSLINLVGDYDYAPKFFWRHPNLEPYYTMVKKYLDLPKRLQTLNRKLDTLNQVFDMLNGYLENKHSQFLEIIIILLIALEIVLPIIYRHT